MAHADDVARPHRDRFGCVPVFWAPLLTGAHELKVAIAIMGRADVDGIARASHAQLVADAGLDARSVRRALASLENRGLIRRIETGTGRRASTYATLITKDGRLRSTAQSTAPSVRATAQATFSVRTTAQGNASKGARIGTPVCAPERTLDCALPRTHTELDRILSDPAHASAREEDQETGHDGVSLALIGLMKACGLNGDAETEAAFLARRFAFPGGVRRVTRWLAYAIATGAEKPIEHAILQVQRGAHLPVDAGDAIEQTLRTARERGPLTADTLRARSA